MDILSIAIILMGVVVAGFVTINFLLETFGKGE